VIRDLAILLSCQLAGEIAVRVLGLPVPGPVLGFLLLFGLMLAAGRRRADQSKAAAVMEGVGRTADRLLGVLGLLFVPAGVGVVTELGLFASAGAAIAATLVVSVVATLLVTVAAFRLASRAIGGAAGEGEADG
jgi:holin-like protein